MAPPLSAGLITMLLFAESSLSALSCAVSMFFFVGRVGMLSCRPISFIVITVSRLYYNVILYYNVNRSKLGPPSSDLDQDGSALEATPLELIHPGPDHTWEVPPAIYSLNGRSILEGCACVLRLWLRSLAICSARVATCPTNSSTICQRGLANYSSFGLLFFQILFATPCTVHIQHSHSLVALTT